VNPIECTLKGREFTEHPSLRTASLRQPRRERAGEPLSFLPLISCRAPTGHPHLEARSIGIGCWSSLVREQGRKERRVDESSKILQSLHTA
jgi:hypothetical protein